MDTAAVPVHRFVTVMRASAALRLGRDEQVQVNLADAVGAFTVTMRTRYLPLDDVPEVLPRELRVEVVGPGVDCFDALNKARGRADTILSILSFAHNAGAEELQVELSFDACAEHDDHEFFQNVLLNESGLPRVARAVDVQAFLGFLADMTEHASVNRIARAVGQYEVALRHWRPGHELMALAHLYMAMEALTPVYREQESAKVGGTDELAAHWAVQPKLCRYCEEKIGPGDLDAEVRRRVLFRGEDEVYREAKKASDGFEHGFLEFAVLHGHAQRQRDRLAFLVRHAVLDLLPSEASWRQKLLTPAREAPLPCGRVAKYIRCTLNGKIDDLAPADQQYPLFRLESSLTSRQHADGGDVTAEPREVVTPNIGPGVIATNICLELWRPDGLPLLPGEGDRPAVVDGAPLAD